MAWKTFYIDKFPSVTLQQEIDHTEWLRLAINNKPIAPFTVDVHELGKEEWLKKQLEAAKVIYPDNVDIASMLSEISPE